MVWTYAFFHRASLKILILYQTLQGVVHNYPQLLGEKAPVSFSVSCSVL